MPSTRTILAVLAALNFIDAVTGFFSLTAVLVQSFNYQINKILRSVESFLKMPYIIKQNVLFHTDKQKQFVQANIIFMTKRCIIVGLCICILCLDKTDVVSAVDHVQVQVPKF